MPDKFDNGFPVEEAAHSLRRAYLHAMQAENIELDPRPEEQEGEIAGWTEVACRAAAILEGEGGGESESSDMDDVSLKETDFAAMLYQARRRVVGGIYETFDEMPISDQIAWCAVGRHAVTLIGFDEDDDGSYPELEPHETHWREWAIKKRGSYVGQAAQT